MSYIDNRLGLLPVERPMRRQWRPAKWMVFAYFIGLIALGSIELFTRRHYDGALIAASEYPWPNGCQPRRYRSGDRVPKQCFDRFQKLSHNWIKTHGLRLDNSGRGKTTYHRIANDAVHGLCVVWEESCTIQTVHPNIFVVDPRITDTTSASWRTMSPGEKL